MARVRAIGLLLVNTSFAAIGIVMAVFPREPNDRLVGACVALFFGGSVALLAINAVLNRGLRAMPSAPLRIDASGRKTLDRLDIFASKQRVLWVAGTGIVFLAAGAVVPATDLGAFALVIGIPGIALGLALLAMAAIMGASREPVISFGVESFKFRVPFLPFTEVPYPMVSSVHIGASASQRFVCVGTDDLDLALALAPNARARRRMISMDDTFGAPWVLPSSTALSAAQLADLLYAYLESFRAQVSLSVERVALPLERPDLE